MRGRLLERESEQVALDRLIGAAAGGSGGVAVLLGPPGIGKTRLTADALDRAEEGGLESVAARAGELERDLAWSVVRGLFQPTLSRRTEDERERLLSGAARLAGPVLGYGEQESAAIRGADGVAAALHGLYWLAAGVAERSGLLVVVDDAHWADAASLRWLAYMARRIEELPILLVVGCRSAEPGVDMATLDVIRAEPATRTLRLSPLTAVGTQDMVRESLGGADPSFCDACHAATKGNPFLLHELIGQMAADGIAPTAAAAGRLADMRPETISRAVLLRLRRLPEPARRLVRAAAVLGSAATLGRAAELAGTDANEAASAADALAEADILAIRRPLEFVHPLVQAAVYADIPAAQRSLVHARAARLLQRDGLGGDAEAAHLLATEPAGDEWCVTTLGRAASAALAVGAPDAATAYLRRALEEPAPEDRVPDLVWQLGQAEAANTGMGALPTLERALALARGPDTRAEIAMEMSLILRISSEFRRAVAILKPVLAELEPGTALSERVEGELINAAILSGDGSARRLAAERLARFADPAAIERVGDARLLASLAVSATGRNQPAVIAVELAQRALAAMPPGEVDPSAAILAADVLAYCDRFAAARQVADELVAQGNARGSATTFGFGLAVRSRVGLREGALRDSEADVRRCMEIYSEWPVQPVDPVAFLVDVLVERGQLDEAKRMVERPPREANDGAWDQVVLLGSRGRLRLALGDPRAALQDLLDCGRQLLARGAVNPALNPWRSSAALAHLALGSRDEAATLAEEELELAHAFGAGRAEGIASRCLGLARGGRAGLELLEESVTLLDGSGARLEHARSLCELGAALRRAGRTGESREPLREALDLAARYGAEGLGARAREELTAAGARPRRDRVSGRDALTASELRVATMAEQGMTNREIAQALFVTLRTVETHLTHVYSKLGIGSRRELMEALRPPP